MQPRTKATHPPHQTSTSLRSQFNRAARRPDLAIIYMALTRTRFSLLLPHFKATNLAKKLMDMSFKCYSLAIKQTREKQSSLKVCFGKIKRQQTLNFSLAFSQLVTQSVRQPNQFIFCANNSIWFWKSLLKVCHHSMVLKMFPIFYLVFQLQKKNKNERRNKSQHHQSEVKKIARKTNDQCLHRLQNQ